MSDQIAEEIPSPVTADAIARADEVTSREPINEAGGDEPAASSITPAPPGWEALIEAEAKKVAKDWKVDPEEIYKNEKLFRQALSRSGFEPVQSNKPGAAFAFQLQWAYPKLGKNARTGKTVGELATLLTTDNFKVVLHQVQGAMLFSYGSPADYLKATLRVDLRSLLPQQLNLEYKMPGTTSSGIKGDLKYEGSKVIFNFDAMPKDTGAFDPRLAGIPGTRGGQMGFGWTFSYRGIKSVLEALVILDASKLGLDSWVDASNGAQVDWNPSQLISLGCNVQFTGKPLDLLPDDIAAAVAKFGVDCSVTLKFFGRVYATKQLWLKGAGAIGRGAVTAAATTAGVVARGGAAAMGGVARGAVAVAEGASSLTAALGDKALALVAANPEVFIGAAAAAGLASLAMTVRGIYIDLNTPNYLPMLRPFSKGYAEYLQSALEARNFDLTAALAQYDKSKAEAMAQKVRAVLLKEDLGEKITPKVGPASHDILFAQAVKESEELGRAAALVEVAELIKTQAWPDSRLYYVQWLRPALGERRGGADAFKGWLLQWLESNIRGRDQDVRELPRFSAIMNALKQYLGLP